MAQTASVTPAPFRAEKTFSSYNQDQGKAYAQIRLRYHPSVYDFIINHHTSTGGQLDTVLDVGCGPGLATYALAPYFTHTIGLDPSEGMLATARSQGGTITSATEPIHFEVSTAEALGQNLSSPIQDCSVDLITAANAAHWFDMSGFWPSAARVLKPGGSVAIWTSGRVAVHPDLPNAAAIQTALDDHRERYLEPYTEPGNVLVQNRYVDLPLPWTLAKPVADFQEDDFLRKDWEPGEPFFVGPPEADMAMFEKHMGTGSAVTRWRQAHPDLAGTEQDVIRVLRREIERLLHEAGVEKGQEKVRASVQGLVLMVKKNQSSTRS